MYINYVKALSLAAGLTLKVVKIVYQKFRR